MSSYAYVYAERLNIETGKWEWYGLWDKNKEIFEKTGKIQYYRMPLWDGQGHIKDLLWSEDGMRDYANAIGKNEKGFYQLSDYVKERAFGKDEEGEEYWKPDVYWISYGDLKEYLSKHKKVSDPWVELEDENGNYYSPKIKNPLRILLRHLYMIVNMKWDFVRSYYNEFRFVFWIEW